MAGLAKNPRVHMRPVVEVNMVRLRMDSLPLERFPRSVDHSQASNIGAVRFGDPVTVHAFFDRGDAGQTRFQRCGVTVKTRDPKNARVKLMRKGYRLSRLVSAYESIRLSVPAHAQDCDQYC